MEDEPQPFEARPTSLDDIDRFVWIVLVIVAVIGGMLVGA